MPMAEPSTKGWRDFATLRTTRSGLRRRARKLETASLKHARTFIVERFDSVKSVRRQALGWLTVVGLLICVSVFQLLGYQRSYSVITTVAGGTYAEGVSGKLETMNPILVRTPAEQSASRLIFSGLLSYDETGHLRGELAKSWRVENSGLRYVVDLQPGVTWHDGKPLTADDVVFTVGLIKNQLVRSPLQPSWSQIKVVKLSSTSVAFDLARIYAAFPHALTFGVLPRHILGSLPPEKLRESDFNRQPIGSGPFRFDNLQVINPDEGRLIVYLTGNPTYVRGQPRLERMQLHVFQDSSRIEKSFLASEINAATDLTSDQVNAIATTKQDALVYRTTLLNGMYAFMRNDTTLFGDKTVRKAFVLATDRAAIIKALHGYASPLNGPLTVEQLPSSQSKRQATANASQAAALLDQAGWQLRDGKRSKDGQPMKINLVSSTSGDYPKVVAELKKQWEAIGATVTTRLVPPESFQQLIVLPRDYDALVYELQLGADPDVFAYWHSSQADPRGLNLSNYKSDVSSDALSSAQLRLEPSLRLPKYQLFVDTWLEDAPAIALYQPQLHYVTTDDLSSIRIMNAVVDRTDRYRMVELWTATRGWRYASP